MTLTNLAAVYFAQKRYEESAATYKRAFVFRAALMGPDDPRWVDILRRYAIVLRVLEQYAEAEAVEVRATGIRVRSILSRNFPAASRRCPAPVKFPVALTRLPRG
jgi:hypothetical protein